MKTRNSKQNYRKPDDNVRFSVIVNVPITKLDSALTLTRA